MAIGSDNVFPKVLLSEGAAPATPAAGQVKTYAKADGLVYSKDDAGVETLMSSGASSGIPATIIDAAGDVIVGTAADTAARFARGADGQVFRSTASTVAWEDDFFTLAFYIDGGGSAITTGRKMPTKAPMAGVIVEARCLLDQSGSISVDIWRDVPANWPPVDGDSLTASAPVAVSGATNSTDTTLTSWGTTVAVGDEFIPNVDSITTATWCAIFLRVKKT